jgi:hypothetical protein
MYENGKKYFDFERDEFYDQSSGCELLCTVLTLHERPL